MLHRHLDYPGDTAPDDLPSAAIVDILDRGDLDDWLPLITSVARNPAGPLAERIAALVDAYPMYGTSTLFRAWLDRCRTRAQPRPSTTLAALRRQVGMTQAEVATRLGISQSDVSKLERRADLRISTLRAYLAALGLSPLRVLDASGSQIALGPGSASATRPPADQGDPDTRTGTKCAHRTTNLHDRRATGLGGRPQRISTGTAEVLAVDRRDRPAGAPIASR